MGVLLCLVSSNDPAPFCAEQDNLGFIGRQGPTDPTGLCRRFARHF